MGRLTWTVVWKKKPNGGEKGAIKLTVLRCKQNMPEQCCPDCDPAKSERVSSSEFSDSVFEILDESMRKLEEAHKLLEKGDSKGCIKLIDEHLKMNREAKKLWRKTRGVICAMN